MKSTGVCQKDREIEITLPMRNVTVVCICISDRIVATSSVWNENEC